MQTQVPELQLQEVIAMLTSPTTVEARQEIPITECKQIEIPPQDSYMCNIFLDRRKVGAKNKLEDLVILDSPSCSDTCYHLCGR